MYSKTNHEERFVTPTFLVRLMYSNLKRALPEGHPMKVRLSHAGESVGFLEAVDG